MTSKRDLAPFLSVNEREFIVKALKEGHRIDGRGPLDGREPRFDFSLDGSSCTVHLGSTRVMATVEAALEPPFPDRPNEGSLRFNVELLPMAAPHWEGGRPGEEATELARLVERGLRESRAVDTEALVVLAGRRVWHLRVDIFVQDAQGNVTDACGLAALAALKSFRRPDVTVGGGEDGQAVTVHPPEQREPVALSIHHMPLPVTFALFEEGDLLALDPSLKEELAAAGALTVTQNPHGELCAVQKTHGVGMPPAALLRCVRLAGGRVTELVERLQAALAAHSAARLAARVRRHRPAGTGGQRPMLVDDLLARQGAGVQARGVAAAAAAGGVGGAAGELDLGSLPESARTLLRKAEQALGDADVSGSSEEEEDDEESGSSSSSGDSGSEQGSGEPSDEELLPDAGGAAAAAAAGPGTATGAEAMDEDSGPPCKRQQLGSSGKPASTAASAAPLRSKKQRPMQRPQGTQPADQFEAIANLIASAGGRQQGGGGGLAAAVKPGAGSGRTKKQKSGH